MKIRTIILCLVSIINISSSAEPSVTNSASPETSDDVILHLSMPNKEGDKFWYRVKRERLSGLPTWNGKTEPPLSLSSAIKIAESYIQQVEPNSKGESLAVVFMKSMNVYSEGQKNHWFYKLSFKTEDKFMNIYVLMDGSVVEPIPDNSK